jgi:hypothetical protein
MAPGVVKIPPGFPPGFLQESENKKGKEEEKKEGKERRKDKTKKFIGGSNFFGV